MILFISLMILMILMILIIISITNIRWTGDLPFKIVDLFKNNLIKWNHQYFNKPLNKKVCKENLETISDILNKNNITFWLSEGTSLGARREGDFIDHDDDVDLGIWYKDYKRFKKIIPHLIVKGFTIDKQQLNNTLLCLSRNNEKIDIDFTGKDIDCIACKTKRADCKSCNPMLKYLKNMSCINFLGNKYLCPDIDYLEYLYGKDWNIPKKEKFNNS